MKAKSINFVTAAGQVIRTEEIGTVSIPLAKGKTIELHNVAIIPGCDSNLILLGQLQESGITFHDNILAMTLMRNRKVIAQAKRDRNLFTLNLAQPGKAMAIISKQPKAMAMTRQGRPTHLVSQNKRIRLWHRRLVQVHISNARVVRASKLVDGINLNISDQEYDPAEVLVDSDDSDMSDLNHSTSFDNVPTAVVRAAAAHTTRPSDNNNILNKLCTPCVGSKSTRVVRQNKSMTATTSKLEKVHIDFWGPQNPPSQSGSAYAAILMCKYSKKTWTLYLHGKDDFVDAFQT